MAKYVTLDTAVVYAYRMATIADITYNLRKYKGSIGSLKYTILHVGTNDVFRLSYDAFMSA